MMASIRTALVISSSVGAGAVAIRMATAAGVTPKPKMVKMVKNRARGRVASFSAKVSGLGVAETGSDMMIAAGSTAAYGWLVIRFQSRP